jgi:uncharacterized protein
MSTPDDVAIEPRPYRGAWPDDLPRHWWRNDAFATHFMNALSLTFPHGEKFFIDAVRAYADRTDDPRLRAEIRGFVGQEGWHRSAHRDYNEWLARLGLPAVELDARQGRKIERTRQEIPPRGWLAATVCLEHFTAVFARVLLHDTRGVAAMHPHFARLWCWHALEELEHKAVAFDLYRAIGGKYSTRAKVMLLVTHEFARDIATNLVALLRADGQLARPKVWWQGLRFLFGRSPGLAWRVVPAWLAFFRPGFHPWHDDDRALIRSTAASLQAAGNPPGLIRENGVPA